MDKDTGPRRTARCPTCRKPSVLEHRPFCSRRCADIDLARWLGGTFVVPGASLEAADDAALPRPGPGPADGDPPEGSDEA